MLRYLHWPWNLLAITTITLPILVSLGFWQINRGIHKSEIIHMHTMRMHMPYLTSLPDDKKNVQATTETTYQNNQQNTLTWRNVELHNITWLDKIVYIDNAIHNSKVGVEIIQFARYKDTYVAINRGFIPWTHRKNLPNIPKPLSQFIQGQLRLWPEKPFQLGTIQNNHVSDTALLLPWADRVAFENIIHHPLYHHVVYIDASHPDALSTTTWPVVSGTSKIRHYGYAVQWFAMAFALCICAAFVVIRYCIRTNNTSDKNTAE